jgi:hypothetical protein
MRRRGQVDLAVSPFIKPDIRTLYITFILRFIQPTSTLHFIKSTFLESHREIFLAIFKRLYEDPYPLVRTVLETSWEGIWQDNRLKKTLKIGLFGEKTLTLVRICTLIWGPSHPFCPAAANQTLRKDYRRNIRPREYPSRSGSPLLPSSMYPSRDRSLL